jgi:hypothetical protein
VKARPSKIKRKTYGRPQLAPWRELWSNLPESEAGLSATTRANLTPEDFDSISPADIAQVAAAMSSDSRNPERAALELLLKSAHLLRLARKDDAAMKAHQTRKKMAWAAVVGRLGFDPHKEELPMTHEKLLSRFNHAGLLRGLKIGKKTLEGKEVWCAFLAAWGKSTAAQEGRPAPSHREAEKEAREIDRRYQEEGWKEDHRIVLPGICAQFVYWRDGIARGNKNKFPRIE